MTFYVSFDENFITNNNKDFEIETTNFNTNIIIKNHSDDDIKIQNSDDNNNGENENIVHNENIIRSPLRILRDHPVQNIIGEVNTNVRTRHRLYQMGHVAFLCNIETKNIKEASTNDYWILSMQEELNQFERNEVWELVPRPSDQSVIGTKWIFKNKVDELGNITRNKASLVAQGYNQEEEINYEETFTPIARLKAICILPAFACFHNFKLYQMDDKIVFLNGFIK